MANGSRLIVSSTVCGELSATNFKLLKGDITPGSADIALMNLRGCAQSAAYLPDPQVATTQRLRRSWHRSATDPQELRGWLPRLLRAFPSAGLDKLTRILGGRR